MKTITIPARLKTVNELLDQARDTNILLRSASGEQFVLAQVSSAKAFYVGESDDFEEEIEQTRANKALMRFLDRRGKRATKGKLVPMAEAEKRLGLERSKR